MSKCGVFSLNAGKYGPEKTPYLDTFHAVNKFAIGMESGLTKAIEKVFWEITKQLKSFPAPEQI